MSPWIGALRPRTLPLALATIVLGTLLAADRGFFDATLLVLTALTATAYQILSNLSNDLGDGLRGADDRRAEGAEKRAVASGLITASSMRIAVGIATLVALLLTAATSWMGTRGLSPAFFILFVLLGIAAILSARGYTLGRFAYGYRGLGDLFVLFFFGPVGVAGSFFLQTQSWDWLMLLPGLSVGLFAAGVLNLNNMRDIETDRAAGKNTLAGKMGLSMARLYQLLLLFQGWLAATLFVLVQAPVTCSRSFLFAATLPLMAETAWKGWKARSPAEFDKLLKPLALQTVLFALLMGIGLLIDSNECSKPLF
ncbi:MAG: 1,4-dihydroxy-2-naphthoate octaprenyltransferase [Flavobacteriaceae bacterium]|nr:1,4-dihydroxy-2-naphthoate octaprenyltransferase [Flavobacteriaceae bacterium]PHX84180.1 MAG: 1,4-dihydroxy-2-naphthoate octaprenyltransferase [Flavobacteriales bacterium]